MYNVLYRIAGEEGDPLQSNGVGEGLSSLRKSLIYPISLRSIGPFLPPHAVDDEVISPRRPYVRPRALNNRHTKLE